MVDDAGARQLLKDYGVLTQPGAKEDRQPELQEVKNLIGRTYPDAMAQLRSYAPYKSMLAKYKYYSQDIADARAGAGGDPKLVALGKAIKDYVEG